MVSASRWFGLLVMAGSTLLGQAPTGLIEGVVRDSSEGVIPSARIVVTHLGTNLKIPVRSNALGRYSAAGLSPGLYSVRAEAPGFSAGEVRPISVSAGAALNVDLKLEVGPSQTTVFATAAEGRVDTIRNTVDTVVSGDDVQDVPLFGRNFLDLAELAPGVIVRDGDAIDETKGFAYKAVGIAGRSGIGTRVQIDGIDVTDAITGSTVANVSSDAVHEFQLTRASLDVSVPMSSSGAVSIITKGGTNQIHGSAFTDYYNQDMGARVNYEDSSEPFYRKRFGTTAGGPFVKNRLFWFVNWERTYQNEQSIYQAPEFPQINLSKTVPFGIRYSRGRLDWLPKPALRVFYSFQDDWNLANGGSPASPYEAVNWATTHTFALDMSHGNFNHSYRFGYVNYRNRNVQVATPSSITPMSPEGVPFHLTVGAFDAGPNSLAPQATNEKFLENWYDGSFVWRSHTIRFGASGHRIGTGGYENFTSSLIVNGVFDAQATADVKARGGNVQDPFEYPFESFEMGPDHGYFFLKPGLGFPYGAHFDTRLAAYVADSFKPTSRLHLNLGLRWEYDSGYFSNDRSVQRDPILNSWFPGAAQFPTPPHRLFSPSLGFAFDPTGRGTTVVRGGFSKSFEQNIFDNLIYDELAMVPPGIGPDLFDQTLVRTPNQVPINIDGKHPDGDYSDFEGQPVKDVIGTISNLYQALQRSYATYQPSQNQGLTTFQNTRGLTGVMVPGTQYKPPYSIQLNLGIQRELTQGTVLSADYIFNRAVGLPIFPIDLQERRDARTLNVAAARDQIQSVLGASTIDQWVSSHPGGSIGDFGLMNDQIWQGVVPGFLRAAFLKGGFTRYNSLQLALRSTRHSLGYLKNVGLNVSYTLSRNEASGAVSKAESALDTEPLDNRDWNNRSTFGPTSLDYTHQLSAASSFDVRGGFRFVSRWTFRTAGAQSLVVPNLGGAVAGDQGFFGTDLNGDGGSTTPRPDVMPGVSAGQFGRGIGSLKQLNRAIAAFNSTYADKLTPQGQALVTAGLFTEGQLRSLGAVVSPISLVPSSAPNPWHNLLVADVRFERPTRVPAMGEAALITPFLDVFNLFNHAPSGLYGGLDAHFGALNFDYGGAPAGQTGSDLNAQRGRLNLTRRIEAGIRFTF